MAFSPSSSPADQPRKQKPRSVLGALRAAVTKVRFLLSFSATRWMLLSSIRRGGVAAPPRRGISFNVRSPSLLDAEGGFGAASASPATSRSASMGTATTRSVSSSSSRTGSPAEVLTRTSSSSGGGSSPAGGGDDDIDRRAEEFIANFYRQLKMERQVSLQLRYVRGNSWDRSP